MPINAGPFKRGIGSEACRPLSGGEKKPETPREELFRLKRIGCVVAYFDAERLGQPSEVAAELLADHPDLGEILKRIEFLEKELGGELQAEEVLKGLKQLIV